MSRIILVLLLSSIGVITLAEENSTTLETVNVTASPDSGYVEPIASTGTKTDTPLMETPLAITVVPQQVLQDQKVTTLDQALVNVSGVRSRNGGLNWESIYLRGFSTLTTFHNGFRIDDDFGFGTRTMSNVESVEVLKGPAAILYGRVEPGGIVNLVTKQPQATPYYSIEQQAGSWDQYLTNFDATGTVNEDKSVLYRLNMSYQENNSWRDGIEEDRTFIAPSLRWIVSPQTQINLEAEYTHSPTQGYDSSQGAPYDTTTKNIIWLPREQNLARTHHLEADTTLLGVNLTHAFNDDWNVKYQIKRFQFEQLPGSYWYWINDFTPGPGNTWTVDRAVSSGDGKWTTTANILDLTGHFDTGALKHTLLLGADYYHKTIDANFGYSTTFSTTDAFNPAPVTGLVIDPTTLSSQNATTNNTGIYVQDQIALPNNIHLLAGLRWQKVTREGTSTDYTGTTTPDEDQSDKATTPRVGILWQASEQFSLYGNYAENFGANNGRDWQNKPLDPESAKQKEVGAKAQFFGGKLTTSLALFELTKTNVAVCDVIHDPACLSGINMTIGEIRSRGPEFDIQGEIQPGWNIIAAYTYTDIVVTKSTSPPGSSYVEGYRMSNVPRNMASLWSTYELKDESLRGWKIGGGITAYSSATDSTNEFTVPGYALVNAMTAYELKTWGNKTTLQFNINNLLDHDYYTDFYVASNGAYFQYGAPRSVTASVKIEF